MKRKRKKSERKLLIEKLDTLCREIVRLRDDNTCQRCSKKVYGSNSHPCHVVPKGNGASLRRFDLLNIFLGCMKCHLWWHNNPLDASEWFKEKFPARYAYLEIYRHYKYAGISTVKMREVVETYKQKLKEMKGE